MNHSPAVSCTPRAQRVLELAGEEAVRQGAPSIGPGHLLMGTMRLGQDAAYQVMLKQGLTPEMMLDQPMGQALPHGHPPARPDLIKVPGLLKAPPLPFSDSSLAALVLAVEEAEALGHEYVGTEHLLLGILGVPEAALHELFARVGIDPARCRQTVQEVL